MYSCKDCGRQFQGGLRINNISLWDDYLAANRTIPDTRVRDKVSMQTVLTALIFRHKRVVPQVYCQKSNRLLGQNIGS